MKKLLFVSIAALAIAGCSSTATNDRLDALERSVAAAQSAADGAMDMAKQARDAAQGASRSNSEAENLARQALETAQETAERLSRMQKECCRGGK